MKKILLLLFLFLNIQFYFISDSYKLSFCTNASAQHMTRESGDDSYLNGYGWYTSYECRYCYKRFKTEEEKQRHESNCFEFECDYNCGMKFHTMVEKTIHQNYYCQSGSNEGRLFCYYCRSQFPDAASRANHEEVCPYRDYGSEGMYITHSNASNEHLVLNTIPIINHWETGFLAPLFEVIALSSIASNEVCIYRGSTLVTFDYSDIDYYANLCERFHIMNLFETHNSGFPTQAHKINFKTSDMTSRINSITSCLSRDVVIVITNQDAFAIIGYKRDNTGQTTDFYILRAYHNYMEVVPASFCFGDSDRVYSMHSGAPFFFLFNLDEEVNFNLY